MTMPTATVYAVLDRRAKHRTLARDSPLTEPFVIILHRPPARLQAGVVGSSPNRPLRPAGRACPMSPVHSPRTWVLDFSKSSEIATPLREPLGRCLAPPSRLGSRLGTRPTFEYHPAAPKAPGARAT
jgi:hypothetical protein